MTMTDDLARIAEVLEDNASRATNAVQRQIMTSNAAVVRDAKARIEALTAEREELVEYNEQFSVDNQFLKKRAEKAEADNARLRAALAIDPWHLGRREWKKHALNAGKETK